MTAVLGAHCWHALVTGCGTSAGLILLQENSSRPPFTQSECSCLRNQGKHKMGSSTQRTLSPGPVQPRPLFYSCMLLPFG